MQTLQAPAASTHVASTLQLVPFIQKKGEEVPDFNTVYYDRATKRIMKRTERKVEAEGMPGKMITDTAVMLGTDLDPRLTIRAGTAILHASEDNIDKVMTELESYKKSSAQLKDTVKREREEGNRLKQKFEHLQREMKTAKAELQTLHEERQAQENTQECLEQVQKGYQELTKEKEQLLQKVKELEEQQKILMQDNDMHSQELNKKQQAQLASLTTDLEAAKEQQVNLQPFKEHILAQKAKML